MAAPKNYTVRGMLCKEDEPEIKELMEKNGWSRRVARETLARRKFQARITLAGMCGPEAQRRELKRKLGLNV